MAVRAGNCPTCQSPCRARRTSSPDMQGLQPLVRGDAASNKQGGSLYCTGLQWLTHGVAASDAQGGSLSYPGLQPLAHGLQSRGTPSRPGGATPPQASKSGRGPLHRAPPRRAAPALAKWCAAVAARRAAAARNPKAQPPAPPDRSATCRRAARAPPARRRRRRVPGVVKIRVEVMVGVRVVLGSS